MTARKRAKWRPRLGLVVLSILLTVLALPLAGLVFFRFYENQLIRQTEAELIAQGTVIAAVFSRDVEAAGSLPLGPAIAEGAADPALGPYRPLEPRLDLAHDAILPPRPDAAAAPGAPSPFAPLGGGLQAVLAEVRRSTLSGFRIVDPAGTVVAGGGEIGLSLAAIEEVGTALKGHAASVLRERVSDEADPPLYSISRGTRIRVFVALPVLVPGPVLVLASGFSKKSLAERRVAGAVYLSRTPSNVVRHLYGQRGRLAVAGLAVLAATLIIAFVFSRTISRPLHELQRRTARIAAGDETALGPLRRHGTREVAELADAFLDMAQKLHTRSDAIRTFATHLSHEMKSPLTAIKGAAELIRDEGDDMPEPVRTRFLGNVLSETERLNRLVRRLIELTRAESRERTDETATLAEALATLLPETHLVLSLDGAALRLRISREALGIALSNLLDNAARHGARRVFLSARAVAGRARIEVEDDGAGISAANRGRIFEPFFTTRRETGGTGLGLGIVAALLKAHDGEIRLDETEAGTRFVLDLPAA